MRIVIVGLGQTGEEIAKEFIETGHEIIVIDTSKELVEEFTNEYDAIGVVGSGASKEVQLKAKANNADVLIALSASDEVNIMSCITAKILGTKHTITKVAAEEYDEAYLTNDLGIDLVINAEYEMATQITRILGYSDSAKTGMFANGKVDVIELKIKENSILAGVKLKKVKEKINQDVIIAAIIRDDKLIVPRGDIEFKVDDEIYVVAGNSDMYELQRKFDLIEKPIKSALVVGSGKIGKYLFKNLTKMKLKTKVIEKDKERCIKTAEEFPELTVVRGNGVDSEMLLEEGIKDYDTCIAITGEDEVNIVVTLFAWSHKVRKLITKVSSINYNKMLHDVNINNTLSPHLVVLSSIHRFIRGITGKCAREEEIKSLFRFAKNEAEAIEFEVQKEFSGIRKMLKEVNLKKDVVIAFIIRNNKIIIPNGTSTVEMGDRVIVIAAADRNLCRLEDVLE